MWGGLSNRLAVQSYPWRMQGRRLASASEREPFSHAGRHVKPPGGLGTNCVCTRRGLSPPLAQRRRLRGRKDLAELCSSRSVGVEPSEIWTTPSSPTSRPARARCRRLCADEDACQHSRCDDSSGPAGSWEWKLLLQGVAEASLYPMLLQALRAVAPSTANPRASGSASRAGGRRTNGRTRWPWTQQ